VEVVSQALNPKPNPIITSCKLCSSSCCKCTQRDLIRARTGLVDRGGEIWPTFLKGTPNFHTSWINLSHPVQLSFSFSFRLHSRWGLLGQVLLALQQVGLVLYYLSSLHFQCKETVMAMCNYLFTSLSTSTLGGTIAFHLPNLFMSSEFLQFQANGTIPKKVLEITCFCNCSQLVFQGNSHSSPSYSWPSHAFMLIICYSDVIEYIRFITISTISKKFWKILTTHLPDLVVSSTKEHKKGMERGLKLSTIWCKLRYHKSTRRCCSDCRCRSWLISCITCVLAPPSQQHLSSPPFNAILVPKVLLP
jgi:hypothetical protein